MTPEEIEIEIKKIQDRQARFGVETDEAKNNIAKL
jgi:hypothetical protein